MPATEFSIVFADDFSSMLSSDQLQAVVLGIQSACSDLDFEPELKITVESVIDNSGTTAGLGFKTCGEAAMHHLLGFHERAPLSGT
jgi:hypothetical protein